VKPITRVHFFCTILIVLISIQFSCTKEAPTVNPGDYTSGSGGITPGYFYPFVTAVYPTGAGVPVNTNYVIVFNMPVDADDFASQITVTGVGIPLYSFTPATGASTTATITFASQLPASTPITVTVGSGIHELVSGTDVPIVLTAGAGFTWTFTTGTAPDVTLPVIAAGTNSPTGLGIPLNTTIQLSFTESGEIDLTSANYNTFYLQDSVPNRIACTYSYTAATNTVTLTPTSILQKNMTYTVIVTTGIKDLSGNPLSAGTSWSFDTVTTIDPFPGNPTITGPNVVYVTDTTADIGWTTSEATNYIVNYGQGDNTGTSLSFLTDYSSTHSYHLNPPLSPGRRYYIDIDYSDFAGNAGATSTPVVEFNTETNEIPLGLDINNGSQSGINWITSTINSGAFIFWRELSGPNYYLYGQLMNSTFSAQWGARLPLFTGSTTAFYSAVEDGLGGTIVLASQGGTGVYAKRINSAGSIIDWGAGTTAGSNGLAVSAAGSSASSAPVYSGFITQRTSGTTEMLNLDNTATDNPLFDFTRAPVFTASGFATNDIIYNSTSHNVATITLSNYNNGVNQSSALITAGNPYAIFNPTSSANAVATDHHTYQNNFPAADTQTASYVNGSGLNIYTDHGITGIATNSNLIRYNDGTNHYARGNGATSLVGGITSLIAGPPFVTFPPSYTTAPSTYTLPEFGVFEDDINLGPTGYDVRNRDFIIINNGTNHLTRINNSSSYPFYYVLTLTPIQGGAITLNVGDWYYIYDFIAGNFVEHASGQLTNPPTPAGGFSGYIWDDNTNLSNVLTGDFVLIQSSPMRITAVPANHCQVALNSGGTITVNNTNPYYIYNNLNLNLRVSGTAKTGSGLDLLIDTINLTTPGVVATDWVFINNPLSTVTNTYNYYELGLNNASLSVTTTSNYYIYDSLLAYVASGTANANTTGTLEDDINLSSVNDVGTDNIMVGTGTTISSVGPPIDTLYVTNGMTVNVNDNYCIYDLSNAFVRSGTATFGSGAGILVDSSADFSLYAGDNIIIGVAGSLTTVDTVTHYYEITLNNTINNNATFNVYSDIGLSTISGSGTNIGPSSTTILSSDNLSGVAVGHHFITTSLPAQQYTQIATFTHYIDLTLSNNVHTGASYTVTAGAWYYISDTANGSTLPGNKATGQAYSGIPAIGAGYLRGLYSELSGVAQFDWVVIASYSEIANAAGHVEYYRFDIDDNTFAINNGNAYYIYRNYCNDHILLTTQFTNFEQIPIDWNFSIASGDTFYVYPLRANGTGTASTMPFYNPPTSYPLLDNDNVFGTVIVGDIVLNYTDGTWATVNNITWRANGAIGLNADIMDNGESYQIISFNSNLAITQNNIIDIGLSQALTGGTTLVTDGAGLNGSISAGDIAYNQTDNDYAMITNVAGSTLTLSRNASFGVGDRYVIVHGTGVLNVWANGGNINGAIYPMLTNATGTAYRNSFIIAAGSSPYTVSDGKGNTYVIYQTGGQLFVSLLNAAGGVVWGPSAVDTSGPAATVLKVLSDNNGGFVILYEYGTGVMHVQHINDGGAAINYVWAAAGGYALTNAAAPASYDMVYSGGAAGDVIVAAEVTNDIYAWRRGVTTWNQAISTATGNQTKPKIYVNPGWTAARIAWSEGRFTSSAGYGIFGMQVDAASGAKPVGWRANASGTADYNGISVILNSTNIFVPNLQIVPYNSGAGAMMIWEDVRNNTGAVPVRGSDLLYIDFAGFVPYP
jgi:hypothetical protein